MEYVLTATKTEARAGSYYDKIAAYYDLTFKLNGYGRSLDQYFAIHPLPVSRGAKILDAGCGTGLLTLALLRAVGPTGRVTGYEIRDDFARRARTNVEGLLGSDVPLDIEVRDAYDGFDVGDLDRVLLDLPEPWRVVKHAETALRPGGILLAYLPTIGQVARLREELASSAFGMIDTLEVLERHWHVDGQSVRPDHRMVAHTGFLTHARLLVPAG